MFTFLIAMQTLNQANMQKNPKKNNQRLWKIDLSHCLLRYLYSEADTAVWEFKGYITLTENTNIVSGCKNISYIFTMVCMDHLVLLKKVNHFRLEGLAYRFTCK